jgi:hypothetical protein
MVHRIAVITLVIFFSAGLLWAKDFGTASGSGKIERLKASGDSEWVKFAPRYSYAYSEIIGEKNYTWIVLTEKEPPMKTWSAAKDPAEARRLWCEKERTPLAALMLAPDWTVNQYMLCPANGGLNTEMLSRWNGLDSIIVNFQVRNGNQVKGSLRTGQGSCPDAKGEQNYCTQTGDYTFDAVFAR